MNNLEDITSLPEEKIEVNMKHNVIAMSPELLSKILDYLILFRKKGIKTVNIKEIARYFSIDDKNLDQWMQTYPQVERKVNGKFIGYSLSKIKEITSPNSPEFKLAIIMILSEDDKLWKSLNYIVTKINKFDKLQIEEILINSKDFIRRVGNNDDVYYGLTNRITKEKTKPKENHNKLKKLNFPHQDNQSILMALSMLHPNCDSLLRIMNFYGNKIAVNHIEAYTFLAKAQKDLSSGISLLMNDLKIRDKSFPDLENI